MTMEDSKTAEPTDDEIDDMLAAPLVADKCPGCGSTSVRRCPLSHAGVCMECDCGEMWRPDDQSEPATPPAPEPVAEGEGDDRRPILKKAAGIAAYDLPANYRSDDFTHLLALTVVSYSALVDQYHKDAVRDLETRSSLNAVTDRLLSEQQAQIESLAAQREADARTIGELQNILRDILRANDDAQKLPGWQANENWQWVMTCAAALAAASPSPAGSDTQTKKAE